MTPEMIRKAELFLSLIPRNQCYNYVSERGGNAVLLEKASFDEFFRKKKFSDGPYEDSFGDNPEDPYNPDRQAFGTLDNGEVVYCETTSGMKKNLKIILNIL